MDYIDKLFLVSSLGQVNNAILISKRMANSERPDLCVILWTKSNKQIAAKLEERARQHFAHTMRVCLPLNPTSGDPYVVFKCLMAYKKIFKKYDFNAAWVSNINYHYSMFCELSESMGKSINFYEEGLGTYKNQEEIMGVANVRARLNNFGLEVKKSLVFFAERSGLFFLYKVFAPIFFRAFLVLASPIFLLLGIYKASMKLVFSGAVARKFAASYFPFPFRYYYSLRKKFNEIVVWYPQYIDKSVFLGDIKDFPVDFSEYYFDAAEREYYASVSVAPGDIGGLFVSQRYASDTKSWFSLLAVLFKNYGADSLYIKFHPKERSDERVRALEYLKAAGIDAYDIDPDNKLDALKIVKSADFKVIYGLTSSVLFYGKALRPNAEFKSLAVDMYSLCLAERLCGGAAAHMLRDYRVLRRFVGE